MPTLSAVFAVFTVALLPASFSRADSGLYDSYLASAAACPGSDVSTLPVAGQASAMLCMIDYARAAHGVGTLARSPLLASSASIKADDIVRCDDLSHTACGRHEDAAFEQAGYLRGVATAVNENLAAGTDLLGSPLATMRAWLENAEHRATLLGPEWLEQGVALRKPPVVLGLPDNAV